MFEIAGIEPRLCSIDGVVGEWLEHDAPAPCTQCGADVTVANRRHKGVWVRGARVNMSRIWPFCSDACRSAWWCTATTEEPFPTCSPRDLPRPTRVDECVSAPGFVFGEPGDDGYDPWWDDIGIDTDFLVIVWEQSLAEVVFEIVTKDGTVHPLREGNRGAIDALRARDVEGFRLIRERIKEQWMFSDPRAFGEWWKAPISAKDQSDREVTWAAMTT